MDRHFRKISKMAIEPDEPTKKAFRSIEGWIELDQHEEAANELHNLPPALKSTTSFIKAWIRIYEAQKAWTNVEFLTTTLNQKKPDICSASANWPRLCFNKASTVMQFQSLVNG
jgi:hypothetical protein